MTGFEPMRAMPKRGRIGGGRYRAALRSFRAGRLHHAGQSACHRKQAIRPTPPRPPTSTSLSEVIEKHPNDPQAYNMRGSVFGQAGRNERGARRFQQGDQPRSELRPGLRQSRPDLPQDRQARSRARRLQQGVDARCRLRGGLSRPRHGLSAAGQAALEAFSDFNKAIAIRPDNAEAYYNRGLLYQSQQQHQFAIDDFSTAIGLTTQRRPSLSSRAA